jgi:hypothetical protein
LRLGPPEQQPPAPEPEPEQQPNPYIELRKRQIKEEVKKNVKRLRFFQGMLYYWEREMNQFLQKEGERRSFALAHAIEPRLERAYSSLRLSSVYSFIRVSYRSNYQTLFSQFKVKVVYTYPHGQRRDHDATFCE